MRLHPGPAVSHQTESRWAICPSPALTSVQRKYDYYTKVMSCMPSFMLMVPLGIKCTALIFFFPSNSLKCGQCASAESGWWTRENNVTLHHFLLTSDRVEFASDCVTHAHPTTTTTTAFLPQPLPPAAAAAANPVSSFTCEAALPQTGNWPVTSFCLISTNGLIKVALGQACQECRCLSN